MYDKAGSAMASAVTAGVVGESSAQFLWVILGGFALFAASLAVLRVIPRHQA
jgi:hypothetical protein